MRIESSKPLTVQMPDGQVQLDPGVPVSLPDDVANKLLKKAPGLVRVVEQTNHDSTWRPGRMVEWNSPRFGVRCGRVMGAGEEGWELVLSPAAGLVWVREDLLHG